MKARIKEEHPYEPSNAFRSQIERLQQPQGANPDPRVPDVSNSNPLTQDIKPKREEPYAPSEPFRQLVRQIHQSGTITTGATVTSTLNTPEDDYEPKTKREDSASNMRVKSEGVKHEEQSYPPSDAFRSTVEKLQSRSRTANTTESSTSGLAVHSDDRKLKVEEQTRSVTTALRNGVANQADEGSQGGLSYEIAFLTVYSVLLQPER